MTKETESLDALLSSEEQVFSALARYIDKETRTRVKRTAVIQLAREGKEVPGWSYEYDPITRDPSVTENPFDTREGLYGGELAALFQALLMANLHDQLTILKPAVQHEICVRLDYCNRIKAASEEAEDWETLTEFAKWLIEEILKIPFPPLALAVFLVKKGILDKWCECERQTR